ncbi:MULTISPECIES: PqqD family protein [Paenibacillus]|uniref:PqqD family protein n=1 Tax=Paenibacillus borealis TaxID=160799 RepID=A0ABX3GRX9_PAEBO|nr:PqqD family protein [Paenibacillus borealis]OMD35200.1 hypothetical protein BSK56_33200 [Paenibacillus borealis]
MDKIYKHSINFRLRNIAGNKILLGNEKAYTLNDTAVIIWNNINGRKNSSMIKEILVKEFNCEESIAEKDLNNFLNFLISINAIFESQVE